MKRLVVLGIVIFSTALVAAPRYSPYPRPVEEWEKEIYERFDKIDFDLMKLQKSTKDIQKLIEEMHKKQFPEPIRQMP